MSKRPESQKHSNFAGLIGAARADITPPVGIYNRNWGAAKRDVASGIHRPLTTNVLTLQQTEDGPPLVLVSLDLGWWKTFGDEWVIRGALIEALGLDPARVMVNLSHTHAGPALCRDDADKPGGDLIEPHLLRVRDAVIECARRAIAGRQEAILDWSYGKCDLAQDRDLPDPNADRIVCGFNPATPADDTLLVGRATSENGMTLATIVNYACHPTTLAWENDLISPDYVGAMRELIETHTGGAPCLFLQGASGELGPREGFNVGTADADAHGRQLGHAVSAVLEGMLAPGTQLVYSGVVESGAPLAIWQRESAQPSTELAATCLQIELELKPELPSLSEIDDELRNCTDRTIRERLVRKRHIRVLIGNGPTMKVPMWIWRVGDAILAAQAQEAYSSLQIHLRQHFPERAVAVMNVTNGSNGYTPPASLYDKDIYQVWQTPFARGSHEAIERDTTAGIIRILS